MKEKNEEEARRFIHENVCMIVCVCVCVCVLCVF